MEAERAVEAAGRLAAGLQAAEGQVLEQRLRAQRGCCSHLAVVQQESDMMELAEVPVVQARALAEHCLRCTHLAAQHSLTKYPDHIVAGVGSQEGCEAVG